MNVLDPFEVAEIRVWPLEFSQLSEKEVDQSLAQAEYTVFQKLLRESKLNAVLNEKPLRLQTFSNYRKIIAEESFPRKFIPNENILTFVSLAELTLSPRWRASSVSAKCQKVCV